jgi:hypothetical protein
MKYEVHHIIVLDDGTKVSVEDYEKHQQSVDWETDLSNRLVNGIKYYFGGGVDLNDPSDRDRVARHDTTKIPSLGRKARHELMAYITKHWPWQKCYGDESGYERYLNKRNDDRFKRIKKQNLQRNYNIYEERLRGHTYKKIGEKYNLSPAMVRIIVWKGNKYGQQYLNPYNDEYLYYTGNK